jgi:CHAD domain-containing protein
MAKATYDFPADIAFRDAARRVLLLQFRKMMDNAPGTRAGEDIEALHDMRVGSRRLRAALGLFAKIFSKEDYRALDKQIGDITDALGAVRDHDVQLDYLRNLRNALPENEAFGIGRLITRQGAKRDKERKALVKALDKLDKDRFERRFRKVLDKAAPPSAGSAGAGDDGDEGA